MLKIVTNYRLWTGVLALLAAIIFLPQHAYADTISVDLCATTGSLTMPDGTPIPVWGYAEDDCSGAAPTVPGPPIRATVGDTIIVTLHNNLNEASAMIFTGQTLIPDLVGAPATGGTMVYSFDAIAAGTFLYEAGPLVNKTTGAQHQTAMGLYGPLIIDPATSGQAYDDAATSYDVEAITVLSEIDPAFHNNPVGFDLRKYKPKYWLINGKAYPDTVPITAAAGNNVLVRYINAGLQHHSMALLGMHQTVIAMDGNPFAYSHRMVAETIPPGQTADVITTVPAAATDGSNFAIYDGNLLLHNSNTNGTGGMLTFINVGIPPAPGDSGPETGAVTATPNPTNGTVDVAFSAAIHDAAGTVDQAEYFIDTIGTDGNGIPMTGSFGSASVTVNATIDTATLATLPAGNHTIYVHGLDNGGNWGKTNFGVLNLDKAGPTTSALTLTPNPSDGTVAVALHGSADDSASGKSNIVAFEYTIDGGAATNSAVTANSPNASLDAVIAAGLTPGTYAVAVRSQDALGNWGPYTTINLVVDTGGPTTSDVTVAPNPNNGAVGVSSGQPSVRVDALITEAAGLVAADRQANLAENQVFVPLVIASSRTQIAESTEATASAVPSGPYVKGAEGFIGTVGVDGTGFAFFAVDGKFDSVSEAVYVMIPLTTIEKLSEGPHPIHVHGQDGTGNWGDTVSVDLLIDRGLPTVSIVSVDPNPTNEVPNIAVVASATDAATTIAAAEWFVGADPGVGNGTAMTVNGSGPGNVTATINVSSWSNGDYTLTVRAKDAAGNWSATDSIVLTVENPLVLYLSTFGTTSVPNVAGPYDDADIYGWSGTNFLRAIDATGIGLPGGVNVDGLKWVSETDLYVSLTGNWNIPGPGSAQDEDILHYDGTNWSVYFDGTAHGLTTSNHDIDAFDIVGGNIYFSTLGTATISGAGGPYDDADIYRWDGTSFSRVFDASGHGLPGGADVDALDVIDENHFYLSFNGNVSISGFGGVQDEDVVEYNNGTWSVFFDATAAGLTGGGQDIDAIDVP